jgi:hypothetical protein
VSLFAGKLKHLPTIRLLPWRTEIEAEPLILAPQGVIWAAINIDYPGHSFSHLGLYYGERLILRLVLDRSLLSFLRKSRGGKWCPPESRSTECDVQHRAVYWRCPGPISFGVRQSRPDRGARLVTIGFPRMDQATCRYRILPRFQASPETFFLCRSRYTCRCPRYLRQVPYRGSDVVCGASDWTSWVSRLGNVS